MSYFSNDHKIANYFYQLKNNYKKNIDFKIWYSHYEPFLNELFNEFIDMCSLNNLNVYNNDETKHKFFLMLYNTSSGKLIDKKEFPYKYGLIKDEDIERQYEEEKIEYENRYKNIFLNNRDSYY